MHYLFHLFIFILFATVNVVLGNQGCRDQFKVTFLAAHNAKRALHGVAALVMDDNLSIIAQDWATHLAEIDRIEFRPNNKLGETIWVYYSNGQPYEPTGYEAVQGWYDGSKYYNYSNPNMATFNDWSSFTQLVWKASQKLGIGCAWSYDQFFIVANYDPRGNVWGQYLANVLPPKAKAD